MIFPETNPILEAGVKPQPSNAKKVKAIIYDVSTFLESCVVKYCELAKLPKESLRKVATPFLEESKTRRPDDDDDLVWPLSMGPGGEHEALAKGVEEKLGAALMSQQQGPSRKLPVKSL